MGTEQIMYCIVALILGMLMANMLKSVCGCKLVEGYAPGCRVVNKDDSVYDGCADKSGADQSLALDEDTPPIIDNDCVTKAGLAASSPFSPEYHAAYNKCMAGK